MWTFLALLILVCLALGATGGGVAKLRGGRFWPSAIAGAITGLLGMLGVFVWLLRALSHH